MSFHKLRKEKDRKRYGDTEKHKPHEHRSSHKEHKHSSDEMFGFEKDELKQAGKRALGNFLMLYAVYIFAWVFLQPAIEEVRYAYRNIVGQQYVIAEDTEEVSVEDEATFQIRHNDGPAGLLSDVLAGQRVQRLTPVDPNFSILIPKLGANAKVISNVDTVNENVYLDVLQQGVAHAAGTALPGQGEHIYLFAHSTNTFSNVSRYNAIFYLLYKLEEQDEVNIYYNGIRHKYHVTGKIIVDPSETQYLTRKTDTETLTLQTCWPPGTVAKRLLVFAEPE